MLILISYLKITIKQVIDLLHTGHIDMAIRFLEIAVLAIDDMMNKE